MKKMLCVILSLIVAMSLFVPAFAAVDVSKRSDKVPVIVISGDGTALEDADGNKILYYKDLLRGTAGDADSTDSSDIWKSVANVMFPFVIEGILMDKWDNYYTNLQKEISELFGDALLYKNGEVSNGSNITKAMRDYVETRSKRDSKVGRGYYDVWDYEYLYDWRLDPLVNADYFHEYIQVIKETTGAEKVGIISQCLGTSVVMAYVSKYGLEDIQGISFNGSVVNGAEILSETISGKFKIDGNAINRCLMDFDGLGMFSIDPFIIATIDLLTKSGVVDNMTDAVKATIYNKIVEGATSALALSTFFTYPSYWSTVKSEDFDEAMRYVFGEEGSQKRTEYAGLIEKINNYDITVRRNLPELYQKIKDNANLCIISKYGFQIAPVCQSREVLADQFASVKCSSVGATTSTIYGTLSEEYINNRIDEGKGRYISPDKQIDASTCLFPENTWFLKGSSHSNWSAAEESVCYTVVTADRQLTIDDLPYSQFMVYSYDTKLISTMTEDNCDTYYWTADEKTDHPTNNQEKITAFLKSFFVWLRAAIKFVSLRFEQSN